MSTWEWTHRLRGRCRAGNSTRGHSLVCPTGSSLSGQKHLGIGPWSSFQKFQRALCMGSRHKLLFKLLLPHLLEG